MIRTSKTNEITKLLTFKERREYRSKKILEEVMSEVFPNLAKDIHTSINTRSYENTKQDKHQDTAFSNYKTKDKGKKS